MFAVVTQVTCLFRLRQTRSPERHSQAKRCRTPILPGADLRDSDLRGVDLCNAELTGALLRRREHGVERPHPGDRHRRRFCRRPARRRSAASDQQGATGPDGRELSWRRSRRVPRSRTAALNGACFADANLRPRRPVTLRPHGRRPSRCRPHRRRFEFCKSLRRRSVVHDARRRNCLRRQRSTNARARLTPISRLRRSTARVSPTPISRTRGGRRRCGRAVMICRSRAVSTHGVEFGDASSIDLHTLRTCRHNVPAELLQHCGLRPDEA